MCSVIDEAEENTSELSDYISNLHELQGILASLFVLWKRYEEMIESMADVSYTGRSGIPRFVISADQLEYLLSLSFSWTEIASLLGVSRMTVYRR